MVFAACVLFSLSFSGGRALANLRGETEQIFYQGVYGDGLCIDRDLEEIARCTQRMAELAQGYAGAGNGLAEAAFRPAAAEPGPKHCGQVSCLYGLQGCGLGAVFFPQRP